MPKRPLFGVGVEISCVEILKGYYEMKHKKESTGNGTLISFEKGLKNSTKIQMKDYMNIADELKRKELLLLLMQFPLCYKRKMLMKSLMPLL